MKYEDIKGFIERCEEHPDHQSGMITNSMIQQRLHEEIDELREFIEQALKEKNFWTPFTKILWRPITLIFGQHLE